jgi:tripeptidyl-peptidase-1
VCSTKYPSSIIADLHRTAKTSLYPIAILGLFASFSFAKPLDSTSLGPLTLKEQVKIPNGWAAKGSPPADTVLKMQIALKQQDISGLQETFLDITNPKSANYSKWLSKEELQKYTSPLPGTVSLVTTWLTDNRIPASSITQSSPDWLELPISLSQMESLLNTKYTMYEDVESGVQAPRTDRYSIPSELDGHIDTIQPTTAFYKKMAPKKGVPSGKQNVKRQNNCDPNNITPSCIQSYYNVDYTSGGGATMGVTGFIGLYASHRDVSQFLNTYYTRASNSDFEDISIGGGENDPSNPDLEGNLDTQYALALSYPNPTAFYDVGPISNSDFGDQMANFASFLSSADNPPSVVSTSYGGEEVAFNEDYLIRICNEFMKAGSRGVSIFFSSGDYGVGGNGESSCDQGFYPVFPASCPWVTAVGGTQFTSNGGEEVAQFDRGKSSGGGFSTVFAAPSYQSADTQAYINNLGGTYSGLYNSQGCGYPDVSLVSQLYDIILNGGTEQVYGTSASSPSFAALISVINDYLLSNGGSTLGFINPLLYGDGRAALWDVTQGYNPGCDSDGFPAAEGWDPTTGLGTLNFAKLRSIVR